MAWGDSFNSAWSAATGKAREAASAVASGATAVGKKGLELASGAASAVGGAASFAADATKRAAAWVGDTAKSGVRSALGGIAEGALSGASAVKDGLSSLGSGIKNAFDKIRQQFGGAPPAEPCIPCATGNPDVDADGALMGNKDGQCTPLTEKGKEITPEDIENAKQNGYSSRSACCAAKRAAGGVPDTIFYVNGINTKRQAHCDTIKKIGDSTCANVVGVYNATEGFLGDALQTGKDRSLIKAAAAGAAPSARDGRNPAVDTLSRVVSQEVMDGRPPTIWAHSQGGAVTSLALYDAGNELAAAGVREGISGLNVTSFGSAAPFWPDGPTYEHYVHVNDATPVNFGLGDNPARDAAHAGAGANVIRFSGDHENPPFERENPEKTLFGPVVATANHGVEDTYIRMHDQEHAGSCDGKP